MLNIFEDRLFLSILLLILALLGAGFYLSDTDAMNYLELFFISLGLIFVFFVMALFAAVGFRSFAIYMSIAAAFVLILDGVFAMVAAVTLSYVVWGFVFAIQLLLASHGVQNAIEWFEHRYSFEQFKMEYYAFLPILYLFFLLLEVIPSVLLREKVVSFEPKKIFLKIQKILEHTSHNPR